MARLGKPLFRFSPVVLLLPLALACTDEKIIEVDRPFFTDPPPLAQGFLGYDEEASSLTVCGNCHVGQQAEWRETHHAEAYAAAANDPAFDESCESCHTTGPNGNLAADGGWASTGETRYHDVQCESCHGPGEAHAANPDANLKPLASILVGTDLSSGCGECHRGEAQGHHPFIEEWVQSRHGEGANRPQYREREGCRTCHGGRGALEAWGVNDEYIEKDGTEGIAIVCAVCHDPHDARNEGQLRFAIDSRDVDTNLCMKCHQRRAVPDLDAPQRGPHSPQGPLLLGENVGWTPPEWPFAPGELIATHGTERNPRLCATCHVNQFEFTDASGITVEASGHLFKPIPCLDATGAPTADEDCELQQRTFQSCVAGGCHGTEDAARSAYIVATQRIEQRAAELDALLAQLPESEFDRDDDIFTIAEGASFNVGLGEIRSSAIHNPFLTEALLLASMQAVEDEYGVAANITPGIAAALEAIAQNAAR